MLDIKLVRNNPELVKENIRKKFQDEKLVLEVADNGVGMTEEILAALKDGLDQDETGVQTGSGETHRGIRNVRDRICRNFGSGYGLEIMSTEGTGTVAVYCLPLILE